MRRMPFDVEELEKLVKEFNYDEKTNTSEIGGNFYIDGEWKGHLLFGDGTGGGQDLWIYYLSESMVLFNYTHLNEDENKEHFVGFGEILNNTIYGITESGNATGYIDIFLGEQIETNFYPFVRENTLPEYFEHQLKVTTAANTFVYLSYPSKNNLIIDSLQDLTTVVKPNANTRLGFGNGYLYYESNVWKSSTTSAAITAVQDNVVVID